MLTALTHALHTPAPHYERHIARKVDPATLIGDDGEWLDKHRNPPEIGRVVRVRYLDRCEGIAVRASDLQYTLRNGNPVGGVIEWMPLDWEIRGNVFMD